jgi:hypothetical protein
VSLKSYRPFAGSTFEDWCHWYGKDRFIDGLPAYGGLVEQLLDNLDLRAAFEGGAWVGGAMVQVRKSSFIPHSIRFNNIVDAVEARCMAVDGPVTPTLQEISEKELAALWRSVQGMRKALDDALSQHKAGK